MRSIGSSEACWRILDFDISKKVPAVVSLWVYLKNRQQIIFREGEENTVARNPEPETQLTAWFKNNLENA
ncbi:hypothetical protein BB558_007397, partial [Smittium angustum]